MAIMTSQAVGNVVLMYSLIFTILEYDSVTMVGAMKRGGDVL